MSELTSGVSRTASGNLHTRSSTFKSIDKGDMKVCCCHLLTGVLNRVNELERTELQH